VRDLRSDLASLRIDRPPPGRARRRRLLAWGALAVLAAGAGGAALWLAGGALGAVEVDVARAEAASSAAPARGAQVLTASGYIVARKKAVVSAKIQGRLEELKVEEGSKVEKDEVIARLENADYVAQVERSRAAVQRSEAELEEANRQLRLSERLEKEGVATPDELAAALSRARIAEAALRQAKADLGVMEALLDNTFIRAPFSGVVIKKMAEVGESVAPIPPGVNVSTSSGAIVALVDMDSLEAEVDVNEAYIAKLRHGQPAEVVVEAFSDRRLAGSLRQIIPSADRTKATVLVKVTILDREPNLRPEMSARATFLEEGSPEASGGGEAPERRVHVPAEAVVRSGGAARVFEVVEGRAVAREVEAGEERDGKVRILRGLAGGEMVILRPPPDLEGGARVKARGDGAR
jgi:RND family efflux transporter MFP subunit